jgi:hypothetical protein
VESDPVESDPVESDPVESDPVESGPVESDPVELSSCNNDLPRTLRQGSLTGAGPCFIACTLAIHTKSDRT